MRMIFNNRPKRICSSPSASAHEKNCPWKSKKGTDGKYSLSESPKNDPQKRPTATVAAAHIVANHAARRIVPPLNFQSIAIPIASRMSP